MPFTPYHFGPALVAKGLLRNRFCLITFAISQVIIDLESLYYLVQNNWPVHRFFHTYVGATLAIFIAVALAKPTLKILRLKASWKAIFIASFFGGYSHVFLDSIMHRDIMPLNPFSEFNGLLRIVSLPLLHNLCIYSGLVGIGIIAWQFFNNVVLTQWI